MQRDSIFESRCKITLLCFYKMKEGENYFTFPSIRIGTSPE